MNIPDARIQMAHEARAIGGAGDLQDSTKRMRKNSQPPQIHKLGHDILWHIFSLNMYMHDDTSSSEYFDSHEWSTERESSLTDVRWASQVCRSWRYLMLQSSSLWARSINLRSLDQKNNRWRDEVFRRTGDAFLSLRGIIANGGKPSTDLLFSVLENHWTRVRILNIRIFHEGVAKDRRWQALYRPAPNLEIFRLFFPATITSVSSSAAGALFSGFAPALHCLYYTHNLFSPSATTSWVTYVRTLVITSIRLPITQIFDILPRMPAVEALEILGGLLDTENTPDLPFLDLSRLRILRLRCSSRNAAMIMRHIHAPEGCRFIVKAVTGPGDVPDAEEMLCLYNSLPHHFSNAVNYNHIQRLYWMFTDEEWDLSADDSEDRSKSNHFMLFQTYFSGNFRSMSHVMPITLLSAFSVCNFGNITSLELEIRCPGLDVESLSLISFLRAFISVETIYTQSDTLGWLNDILVHTPSIFPRLTTLIFADGLELTLDPGVIMRFLLRRRDSGTPIRIFDLRKCRSLHQELLLFVEGIDELSVLWDPVIRHQCDAINRSWTDVDRDSD